MALKKKIQITIRVTDDGKVVDSFTTKALLGSSATKKANGDVEEKDDTTQADVKANFTTVEDFLAIGTIKADLSLRSKLIVEHDGCQIKAKAIGFQSNSGVTITSAPETASAGSEVYQNITLTGN